eukprot:3708616-Prymnesium_polylepis.1
MKPLTKPGDQTGVPTRAAEPPRAPRPALEPGRCCGNPRSDAAVVKTTGLQGVHSVLVKGLQDDDMWEAITRATRKACSLFQYENAISIL